MFEVLKHRTYRHFFAAQVASLVGTGMLTVALGLLAYHLAGPGDASAVLGIVNTVIYVRRWVGGTDQDVALFMAAFGGCCMLAALLLPRMIDRLSDRSVMLAGAAVTGAGLAVLAITAPLVTGGARAVVLIACWAMRCVGH